MHPFKNIIKSRLTVSMNFDDVLKLSSGPVIYQTYQELCEQSGELIEGLQSLLIKRERNYLDAFKKTDHEKKNQICELKDVLKSSEADKTHEATLKALKYELHSHVQAAQKIENMAVFYEAQSAQWRSSVERLKLERQCLIAKHMECVESNNRIKAILDDTPVVYKSTDSFEDDILYLKLELKNEIQKNNDLKHALSKSQNVDLHSFFISCITELKKRSEKKGLSNKMESVYIKDRDVFVEDLLKESEVLDLLGSSIFFWDNIDEI
eukprot:GHVL01018752.1.p1 GENE.GHVL01018752.1~~GHVL01018752.1.p1  ORF type:complete len:266 (+),score=57.63 GHVL01018752.1:48-845(+)